MMQERRRRREWGLAQRRNRGSGAAPTQIYIKTTRQPFFYFVIIQLQPEALRADGNIGVVRLIKKEGKGCDKKCSLGSPILGDHALFPSHV